MFIVITGGSSYGAPAPQYGAPAQAPVVHKHVYVHIPPPEPQVYKPRKVYPQPVPQKHYKIVFIKAPTPPPPTVPDLPPIAPPDEQVCVFKFYFHFFGRISPEMIKCFRVRLNWNWPLHLPIHLL